MNEGNHLVSENDGVYPDMNVEVGDEYKHDLVGFKYEVISVNNNSVFLRRTDTEIEISKERLMDIYTKL